MKISKLFVLSLSLLLTACNPSTSSSSSSSSTSSSNSNPTSSTVSSSNSSTTSSTTSSTSTDSTETKKESIVINQVFGASNDGIVSHSFIELYNKSSETIDLSTYSIQYISSSDGKMDSWVKLDLQGKIEANNYYLIRGKQTTSTGENLNYVIPNGDISWDVELHNKGVSIALTNNHDLLTSSFKGDVLTLNNPNLVDLASCGGNDATKDQDPYAYEKEFSYLMSKKKGFIRKDFIDTNNNKADFFEINYSNDVEDSKLVRNSKGEKASKNITPSYTPVVTSSTKYQGYNNDKSSLNISEIARYNSNAMSIDGGSEEIVAYNAKNGFSYTVNGLKGVLSAVNILKEAKDEETLKDMKGTEIDVKSLVKDLDAEFNYYDMTSVSCSSNGDYLAVSLQDADYTKNGRVALFNVNLDGSLSSPKLFKVGVQPDCIKFSSDDKYIITADEAEPREGYSKDLIDPKGSVSVIDIKSEKVDIVDFTSFDSKRDELVKKNIIMKKDNLPSLDLEPEFIATNNDKVFVSLQENNAIAILNLETKAFENVVSAGFIDYSKQENAIDLVVEKTAPHYNPKTYKDTLGVRMPDGISTFTKDNKTYLLTANEGDAREWGDENLGTYYTSEAKKKELEALDKTTSDELKPLDTASQDGLDATKNYLFGGRSFTLFEVNNDNTLKEVYDSKNEFEKLTNEYIPDYYNASNDDNEIESRTLKKGTEPEFVTTGEVDNKLYAFVTLERISGVMVYDLSDISNIKYVNYVNSRDFTDPVKDDVSPEGLAFIPQTDKNSSMLLASCEVSGTLACYNLKGRKL